MRHLLSALVSVLVLAVAACGDDGTPVRTDARVPDATITTDTPVPYRHTIQIDGTDDFFAGEMFDTTSSAFAAYVTWDDANLYIGYAGPDLAPTVTDAATKWLFVYLDTTADSGQTQSEEYNSQRATFPTGFTANYYVRYKVDGTLTTIEHHDGSGWTTVTPGPAAAQAEAFVELGVPLSSIGSPATVGIVTWMINEKAFEEGTFAGLYSDNFTDGYAANLTLTAYLEADFTSTRVPNSPAARRP
jgi:hypothetical protein